jgi:ribosomal protein S18 acetylase RimI-like enzyme
LLPITDISIVNDLIAGYSGAKSLTNNYLLKEEYQNLIDTNSLYFVAEDENLYFLIKRKSFFRVYYFINNISYPYSNYNFTDSLVLEVLYRGAPNYPEDHIQFWNKSGFELHKSRDNFFLKNAENRLPPTSDLVKLFIPSTDDDFNYVKNLIETNLDYFTGNPLSFEEIRIFAQKGFVWIASINSERAGFLQAGYRKKIFWLDNIVVEDKMRGKGVANTLVSAYLLSGIEHQCSQFQLWVEEGNEAAKSLYKKYGFDYLKRSTVSMIRMSKST